MKNKFLRIWILFFAVVIDNSNTKIVAAECKLFSVYPNLENAIGYIHLAELPTPITHAANLGNVIGVPQLFIKRDDLTGKIINGIQNFSGNKVRKLEFALKKAIQDHCDTILTFGCAGSNHALATVWYAKQLGLHAILMLKPQHNSGVVRRNLLLDLYCNAEMHYSQTNDERQSATNKILDDYKQRGTTVPYVIPTGASYPIGVLGFVNAAFELYNQIINNMMPMPDRIYVPLGSAGTFTGLLLGIKALGLPSKIVGITIEPEEMPGEFLEKVKKLFNETNELLHSTDLSFPLFEFNETDFEILYDHAGQDYALFTDEAVKAIKLMKQTEDIDFDGVYSGKTCAGMLADLDKHAEYKNQTILFWHTFCGYDFAQILKELDYRNLPINFHHYFENDVQELDK